MGIRTSGAASMVFWRWSVGASAPHKELHFEYLTGPEDTSGLFWLCVDDPLLVRQDHKQRKLARRSERAHVEVWSYSTHYLSSFRKLTAAVSAGVLHCSLQCAQVQTVRSGQGPHPSTRAGAR